MFEEFGTVDILINNAGLQQDAPLKELKLDQCDTVINLTSYRAIALRADSPAGVDFSE